MSDIIDKLFENGIRIKAAGIGDHKVICPQCSKSRKNRNDQCLSVKIDNKGAAWNCHHCGWVGGFMDDNHSYQKYTPKPKTIVKPVEQRGPQDQMLSWFAARGIEASTVAGAAITRVEEWMPQTQEVTPVIAFPYFRNGEVVNYKFRSRDKQFKQVKGAEKIFYGLDKTAGFDEIYIVEGEIDALSIRQCDLPNVWSVPDGAPKHVKDQPVDPENDTKFSYLWNCEKEISAVQKFIIATDADGPGDALAEELARRLGRDKCWRVHWPDGYKDANEVLVDAGRDALIDCLEAAKPWPISGLHEADDYRDEVLNLYKHGRSRALSTGWDNLDEYMTIAQGQLSIVTGIPNSGKSEWVDALMVNLANDNNWSFAVASFENPPAEHISKLVEKKVGMPYWDGPNPRMTEDQLQKGIDWVNEHFYFIRVDGDGDIPDLDWVLEKFGAAVMRFGVKGIVLDPWNELEHKRPSNMSETEYIGQSLTKIKKFAAIRGVHVWVVAHPSKIRGEAGGPTPMPALYDIAGSANWANKADLGIVVHRPSDATHTEIHIKKCRMKHVGAKGFSLLNYDKLTGRYYL